MCICPCGQEIVLQTNLTPTDSCFEYVQESGLLGTGMGLIAWFASITMKIYYIYNSWSDRF